MATESVEDVVRIPYRPPFVVGTQKSRQGASAIYAGVDFGPTHFVGKLAEGQIQEVYRFVGYDALKKESMVVPVSNQGLVMLVINAIGQQK